MIRDSTAAEEEALVRTLGKEMLGKLEANRDVNDRHWLDPAVTLPYMMTRLNEEFDELDRAIEEGQDPWPEAADIANIAAMIAHRFGKKELPHLDGYLIKGDGSLWYVFDDGTQEEMRRIRRGPEDEPGEGE